MAIAAQQPAPSALLAAGRSSRLKRTISRLGVTRKIVGRFVPGEAESTVVAPAAELLRSGRSSRWTTWARTPPTRPCPSSVTATGVPSPRHGPAGLPAPDRQDRRDLSGPDSRIRLCKGAYAEHASVAFRKPAEVTDSYLRCLRILMAGEGYPMVASHDPKISGPIWEPEKDWRSSHR